MTITGVPLNPLDVIGKGYYLKIDDEVETSDDIHSYQSHNNRPLIKELPFDRLEEYQYTEEDRVKLVYGDIDYNTKEFCLNHESDSIVVDSQIPILLGYDEPKPLVQKLVLRALD